MKTGFKTFVAATLLLGSVNTLGLEMSCIEQASAFSSKVAESKVTKLSNNCIKEALSHALFPDSARRSPASIRPSSDPKMVDINAKEGVNVYSHDNFVVLEKKTGKYKVYAGSKTGLREVKSVSLSQDAEFIAVLNEAHDGNEIIIFKTAYSGNISAHKVIRGPELAEANQISYDTSGENIYVHDPVNKRISIVSADKDSRKSSPEFTPVFTQALKLDDQMKVNFIKSHDSKFLTLSGKYLYSYNEDLKKQNWVLDLGAIGLENPKGFQVSETGKELEIYTQNNKLDIILFPGK